jgi:protein SCO1/2
MFGGYGLLGALLIGVLWFAIGRPVQVAPRIRPAPTFTLTDERGQWLASDELEGRITVLSFSYARCGAACAEPNSRLLALRDELASTGRLGNQVVLLTISVDPEHDTPERLREYAARLGAESDSWHFLTGSAPEIKEIVGGGFGVYYGQRESATQATFELDQRVVMVDGGGVIRGEYAAAQLEPWRVLRDIGLIQREAASTGWERPVYDAAHLFVCYPQ